jgi:HK97 family phage prohead protease
MATPIKGYGAVFGNLDRKGQIFEPGAFSGFLASDPGAQRVPLLWYHNLMDMTAMQIGITTSVVEDEVGLLYEGELADTSLGRDVAALLEQSDLGSSLHFFGGSGVMDTETGVVTMNRASYDEFSLLTMGHQANPLATAGLADTFESDAAEVVRTLAAIRETFQAVA